MRTVPTNVETAIEQTGSSKMGVKAIVQPSRVYFSALTDDYPFDGTDFSVITDTPRPQCMCYSPTKSGAVTFVVQDDGDIVAMVQGSATQTDTGANTDAECKPGVWDLGNGNAYLWYTSLSGGGSAVVKRDTVDMSTLIGGSTTTLTPTPTNFTIDKGSCTPVSSTEVVYVYRTTIGGVSVAYYNGSSWKYWGRRFLSPNRVMDDGYWTVYSAAVKFNNDIYVYITDMDTGEVKGVQYDTSKNRWTDTFLAIPAAESRFCIGNARVVNEYIHMSGQFHRTGDLEQAQKWSLVVRSMTGRNFSWDRHTGISTLGYQFQFDTDGTSDTFVASDRNSVGEANLSYYFSPNPATQVTLEPPNDIINFTSSSHSAATMTLRSADESLIDNAIIVKGNRVKVQITYYTENGGGLEYVGYNNYIITSISETFQDGKRGLVLQLTAEGVWKTSQIAFPFYAELISKSTSVDNCDDRDLSFEAPGVTSTTDTLVVDFWPNEAYSNPGESIVGHACSTANGVGCELQTGRYDMNTGTYGWLRGTYKWGFQTQELQKKLGMETNPDIVGTELTIKFYGWSNTSIADRPPDNMYIRILIEEEDGTKTEMVCSQASDYRYWPREYPGAMIGSYPIIYTVDEIPENSKLVQVRIIVQNTYASGYSELCPERLEIDGVKYDLQGLNASLTWLETKPDSYTTDDPTMLEVPGMGIPYVRFLSRPYTAYNFQISSEFVHDFGDTPASSGTVAWGAVGMAADGSNYMVARQNVTDNKIELVVYRNGSPTVLTSAASGGNQAVKLNLEHRDGQFIARVAWNYDSETLLSPILTWQWNEVSHGVISASETGQMHVGCYGLIDTPKFRTPGFNASDSDGIGAIQQSDMSDISGFPPSGKVMLDGVLYSYSSKTSATNGYGPYQVRNSFDYGTYSKNGIKYSGLAVEIALFKDHDTSGYLFKDYLFSGDNGHTWKIKSTLWEVVHSTAGVPNPLNHRSRWYGDSFNDNWFSTDNRAFVGPGLIGVTVDEGMEESYFHPYGTWCFQAATNRIWVKSMLGSSSDTSTNIQDMVTYLCESASVEAEFPGNWTNAAETITSTPYQLASTETLMPGGYDVRFTTPSISSGNYLATYASNVYLGDDDSTEAIEIWLKNNGGTLEIGAVPKASSAAQYFRCDSSFSPTSPHDVRIFWHEEFASIYLDGVWATTFAWNPDTIHWPKIDAVTMYMRTSGISLGVTDIEVIELFDWREAIYFESELSVQSAISSVIQERPVEVIPKSDGGLWFTYHLVRDTITYTNAISKVLLRQHTYSQSINSDSGSDAIIHYRDIAFAFNQNYADEDGFFTKVFMLSGLDTGAKAAGTLLLEKADENQYTHSATIRPDIRIEPGDKLVLPYLTSGTQTQINHTIIINDVGLRISEGQMEMTISGRDDL